MDKKKEKKAQTNLKIHYWHPLHGIQLFGNCFILNTHHWLLFRLKHSVPRKNFFFKSQYRVWQHKGIYEKLEGILAHQFTKNLLCQKKKINTKPPENTQSKKQGRKKFHIYCRLSPSVPRLKSCTPMKCEELPWDQGQNSSIGYTEKLPLKDFRYHLKPSGCPWHDLLKLEVSFGIGMQRFHLKKY